MKWFWRVNYLITIYSVILLIGEFLNILLGYDSEGYDFTQKYSKYYMIGNNDLISIFLFCIEWIQIPLVLCLLIIKKLEFIKLHWFYFIFLIFLSIAKITFYFFEIGGWILHQP